MLQHEEMVRVKNTGDSPVELAWNSKHTVIEPGKMRAVQLEALIAVAGDPRSTESYQRIWLDSEHTDDLMIPARSDEVLRIRMRNGMLKGDVRGFQALDEEGNEYDPRLPSLEVYDDEDNRVYTVIEDPTGEKGMPDSQGEISNAALLLEVNRLRRQLQLHEEALGEGGSEHVPVEEDELPSADEPGAPALKKRKPDADSNVKLPVDGFPA